MKAVGPYMTWADGSPLYDQDGYLIPPPEAMANGLEPVRYRALGKWFPYDGVDVFGELTRDFPPYYKGELSSLDAREHPTQPKA